MTHDERSRCIICDAPIETHFVVPIDAPQGALCSANCVNRWFQRSYAEPPRPEVSPNDPPRVS